MRRVTGFLRALWPLYSSVHRGGKLLFSEQYLLYTNIGLSIGISAIGDVLQQNYQHKKNESLVNVPWDHMRTAKMAASGVVIGSFIHYWYQHLDVWLPGRSLKMLSKKVFLDLVVSSPVCVFLFLMTAAILDGQRWILIKEEFRNTGKTMLITDSLVWTPAQALNFYFLPTRFRILFDNSVSLAIDTYFSHLRFGEYSSYQMRIVQSTEDKKLPESTPTLLKQQKTDI
uniref:Mpv17-like protein 2 n=1 Tax=Arion vulgaris TaxID=1028688 RepID=A0A0B7A3D3_9EUPU